MHNFDLLSFIAGMFVIVTIVAAIVWAWAATLNDPNLEQIAEQRGDYEPWTVR